MRVATIASVSHGAGHHHVGFLGFSALALIAYLDGAHRKDDGDDEEQHASDNPRDDGLVSLVLGTTV